jgi:hypothetical protein
MGMQQVRYLQCHRPRRCDWLRSASLPCLFTVQAETLTSDLCVQQSIDWHLRALVNYLCSVMLQESPEWNGHNVGAPS